VGNIFLRFSENCRNYCMSRKYLLALPNSDCTLEYPNDWCNSNSMYQQLPTPYTNPYTILRPQCTVLSLWSTVHFHIGYTWRVFLPMKVKSLSHYSSQTPNVFMCPRLQGICYSPVKDSKCQQFSMCYQLYHLQQFYTYALFNAYMGKLSIFPTAGLHL
jgi:hypothetical protein